MYMYVCMWMMHNIHIHMYSDVGDWTLRLSLSRQSLWYHFSDPNSDILENDHFGFREAVSVAGWKAMCRWQWIGTQSTQKTRIIAGAFHFLCTKEDKVADLKLEVDFGAQDLAVLNFRWMLHQLTEHCSFIFRVNTIAYPMEFPWRLIKTVHKMPPEQVPACTMYSRIPDLITLPIVIGSSLCFRTP